MFYPSAPPCFDYYRAGCEPTQKPPPEPLPFDLLRATDPHHLHMTLQMNARRKTAQVCSQRLLSPQLRMVFDDAMRASARVLALHSLMDGGMSGSGTGPGAGKGSSLDRMGLLRTSLVSSLNVEPSFFAEVV